ncbi:hypothetical protein GCM10022419_014260 [Nonomuraea rosea]|uniref:Uncharacterized protein n=1 Tax=Nonomuraea rosea TaxID=638574 RepID=A0ABP6VKI2_9ACTN
MIITEADVGSDRSQSAGHRLATGQASGRGSSAALPVGLRRRGASRGQARRVHHRHRGDSKSVDRLEKQGLRVLHEEMERGHPLTAHAHRFVLLATFERTAHRSHVR